MNRISRRKLLKGLGAAAAFPAMSRLAAALPKKRKNNAAAPAGTFYVIFHGPFGVLPGTAPNSLDFYIPNLNMSVEHQYGVGYFDWPRILAGGTNLVLTLSGMSPSSSPWPDKGSFITVSNLKPPASFRNRITVPVPSEVITTLDIIKNVSSLPIALGGNDLNRTTTPIDIPEVLCLTYKGFSGQPSLSGNLWDYDSNAAEQALHFFIARDPSDPDTNHSHEAMAFQQLTQMFGLDLTISYPLHAIKTDPGTIPDGVTQDHVWGPVGTIPQSVLFHGCAKNAKGCLNQTNGPGVNCTAPPLGGP